MNPLFRSSFGLTLALAAAALAARASDAPLAIHGAVSATAAYSDRYAYLGDTAESLKVVNTEATLNATHQFRSGLRFAAQVYGYRLGNHSDLTLDFASLDYRFSPAFGIRVGRNKQALGLYGDTQDLDMVRTFALLPLDFYPKPMRSYGASYEGAGIYGTINLPAGSLDYQVYYGKPTRYGTDDPWLAVVNESNPVELRDIHDVGKVAAGAVYWNTPVEGLKIGGSVSSVSGQKYFGVARDAATVRMIGSDVRVLPDVLPPGLWEHAIAGGPAVSGADRVTDSAWSIEFARGRWVLAGEYKYTDLNVNSTLPVLGFSRRQWKQDGAYAMATLQATDKLQVAAYYGESFADTTDRDGKKLVAVPAHRGFQKDLAFATCWTVRPWWLLKAEFHALNGTKILTSENNGDAAGWKGQWTYVVLKSTVSF